MRQQRRADDIDVVVLRRCREEDAVVREAKSADGAAGDLSDGKRTTAHSSCGKVLTQAKSRSVHRLTSVS